MDIPGEIRQNQAGSECLEHEEESPAMAHILAIELRRNGCTASSAPPCPAAEPENVATLWVDWDMKWWHARTRQAEFVALFGVSQGMLTSPHGYFIGAADQVLATPSGEELLLLQQYSLNAARDKLAGMGLFVPIPGAVQAPMYKYYTYFWRKLRGQDMTKRERTEEMFAIAMDKYGSQIGGDALAQLRGLATAESLFSMGAILMVFATAAALGWAGFAAALKALCGAADVATNWAMYKPYWDRFAQQVNTGNDLDYGAQALATLLGALMGYTASNAVAAGASSKLAPKVQVAANKFANAVRGHSPARWKAAAEAQVQELKKQAAESGDPNNTKIDPGKELTAEDRRVIAQQFPELVKQVRENGGKFGFAANIAEGYAKLAFHNGWTIFARTSKRSSIPHHLLGPENVTGKSLFVEYKIDATHGVIVEKAGMNVEKDFYSPDTYAAKQMAAIYASEHPNAPKGSFEVTPEVMQAFRAAHKFEFRPVQMGGKLVKVLFHNGKMVISDVDLMGIYVKVGNDLVPLPQWMIHNDAAFLKDFINRSVGGVDQSFHGQQDVGRNDKGQPFRSPDAGEEYAMFSPDMKLRKVKGTAQLEVLYRSLHILWPYETYLTVRGSVTHFVVAASRRRKDGPNR